MMEGQLTNLTDLDQASIQTFGIARIIPFLISIIWLGIGIWQWFVLSKWTKKYERYKELQKKIDEKLNDDNIDDRNKK